MAVAHTLLVLVYQVSAQGKPYQEHAMPAVEEAQRKRLIRHPVRCLGRLGINVGFSPQRVVTNPAQTTPRDSSYSPSTTS